MHNKSTDERLFFIFFNELLHRLQSKAHKNNFNKIFFNLPNCVLNLNNGIVR